ncbi:MAG: hypothetical protein WA977_06295 [Halobacteriota archaeon]
MEKKAKSSSIKNMPLSWLESTGIKREEGKIKEKERRENVSFVGGAPLC